MTRQPTTVDKEWMALPCVCANVRRLARLTTRFYDEAMRDCGMEIGQFGLTATIARLGEATQAQLARGLAMDTTSLTRTLAVMLQRGWIEKRVGVDRRSRVFAVTAEGRAQVARTRPAWLHAQERIVAALGTTQTRQLALAVEGASLAISRQAASARPKAPAKRLAQRTSQRLPKRTSRGRESTSAR